MRQGPPSGGHFRSRCFEKIFGWGARIRRPMGTAKGFLPISLGLGQGVGPNSGAGVWQHIGLGYREMVVVLDVTGRCV